MANAQATVFRTQPQDQITVVGGSVTFTVDASGYTPLQWMKLQLTGPALRIAGATNTSLTIHPVKTSDAGAYYCLGPLADPMDIFSSDDVSQSANLYIDVMPAFDPNYLLQPSKTVLQGSTGQMIDASATGGDLTYIYTIGSGTVNVGGASDYPDPTVCMIDTSHDGVFLYKLTVTNLAGSISATSTVMVVGAPGIATQPADKTVALGSNWTFSVVGTNTAGLYKWYFNGTNRLVSATNSYTVTSATTNNAGTYSVILTNIAGVVTSRLAVLTVQIPPSITTQPTVSNVVAQGSSVTNSVVADGDSVYYQWYFAKGTAKAAAIASATSTNLTLSSVTTNNSGTYTVVVTNSVGTVTSAKSVLTVIPPPAISKQPVKASLTAGQKLSLTVTATGTKPSYTNLFYQWYVGTTPFDSTTNFTATNATFVITNASATAAGNYSVVITNFGGSTTSSVVAVTVGADAKPPVLKITDPSKSIATVTNTPYTIKGTATDDVLVTNVAVSVDGINFANASTTNGWAKWSQDVTLSIGSNTVWVTASDYSGNTTTNTLKLFYAKWYTLTVTNVGTGNGSFTGASNRVQFGSTYTLTAKASVHDKFIKWIGWSGMTISTNGTANSWKATTNLISFIATNDVYVTNEIDTNLFWTAAGSYNGLIFPTNAPTHSNVGFVAATVTSNLTYSAKVLLAGRAINLSGDLTTNGAAAATLPDGSLLSFALGNNQLTGSVYDSTGTNYVAALLADLAYYSKASPATSFAGSYTIAIPPDTNSTCGATNGYGYGTVTVSTSGTITFAGGTADGHAVSQSVPISQNGDWPLFVQMYTRQQDKREWRTRRMAQVPHKRRSSRHECLD